jgi:hypothetical protein
MKIIYKAIFAALVIGGLVFLYQFLFPLKIQECGTLITKFGQDHHSKHHLYQDLKFIIDQEGKQKSFEVSDVQFVKHNEGERVCIEVIVWPIDRYPIPISMLLMFMAIIDSFALVGGICFVLVTIGFKALEQ